MSDHPRLLGFIAALTGLLLVLSVAVPVGAEQHEEAGDGHRNAEHLDADRDHAADHDGASDDDGNGEPANARRLVVLRRMLAGLGRDDGGERRVIRLRRVFGQGQDRGDGFGERRGIDRDRGPRDRGGRRGL